MLCNQKPQLMKKIKLLTTILAILFAGIGVIAKSTFQSPIIYYVSLWPGPNCDTEFEGDVCDLGSSSQCVVYDGNDLLYVSRKVSNGPCKGLTKSDY